MLERLSIRSVGVAVVLALGTGVIGCTGHTPAEIAESYGVLNDWGLSKSTAEVFQSGEAEKMVQNGYARVRNRELGSGEDRVLVTEYLIEDEVYRIEVRKAVNPLMNVPWTRIRYAQSRQGPHQQVIGWGHLASVISALRDHSYEAQATIAHRAWRGTDGKIRPVRVQDGNPPRWRTGENDLDLSIRTMEWPIVDMWFRGLTSDGRRRNDDSPMQSPLEGEPESQDIYSPDGRWIMVSKGPGVQCPTIIDGQSHFVNLELGEIIVDGRDWP